MPLTESDFPHEVVVAFFLYYLLSDRWDGASGTYFGKDWAPIEAFFNIHKVEDKVTTLQFMKMIESHSIDTINDKMEQKRKQAERSANTKNSATKVQG